MKRNNGYRGLAVLAISLFATLGAVAQSSYGTAGITVGNPQMIRTGDGRMTVSMDLRLDELQVGRNSTAVFVPVVINGSESRTLTPVGVYGRTRWFQAQRAGDLVGTAYRYSRQPDVLSYHDTLPYEDWMDGARLELRRQDYGCCGSMRDEYGDGRLLAEYREDRYVPSFRYLQPKAEKTKTRELQACAYIDYPVSDMEIHPDYRNNRVELQKIIATIDSLRNDGDVTVSSLTIKGFASPEGPYENNKRLAKGRTEALKRYVCELYDFGEQFIATDYEAEDWAGLRAAVEGSDFANRTEILAAIDDMDLAPDAREWRIKSQYPEEYAFMLQEIYPGLRRSDYRIEYTIRSFSDIEEIRAIMATSPQKLSLGEMYLLAQTMEPGSDEFNEVFETAVRMYPDDETANLNAANTAMARGDLRRAAQYLAKAGDSDEAVHARRILAELRERAEQ